MIKYRSKRTDQSIVIHHKHWKNGNMYPSFFGTVSLKASDPSGKVLEIGVKDMTHTHTHTHICRLCDTMDMLQSRFQQPTTKARKRYRLKRAWKRLQQSCS
jgi:hypothetical protein